MTLNQFRGILYRVAKSLGDIQALFSRRENAIPKRVGRRIVGKATGRLIGRLFR